ncbi:MAG: 23S rRNA (adenine(2503)-C(2))-methyltransferase RlmN, partial [Flavobacteriaceae bacterium]
NYKNTLLAIQKITSPDGLGMSPKRITVSTSGITKIIREMADQNPKFKLAVSLHSAIEETRNRLMPFTKKFPLSELLEALKYWYDQTKSKITFEVVVWQGINDKQEDIDALVAYCKQVPSKVNLIEYNSIGDNQFVQAKPASISAYISALEGQNISVTVRQSRGNDIDAACGQLANKQQ